MKFAIYGVSGSGKNFFIDELRRYFSKQGLPLYHINGSETLKKLSETEYRLPFDLCNDTQKNKLRTMFADLVCKEESRHEYIVADGHYAFYGAENKLFSVCTEADINCYDRFFYIDTEPEYISERINKPAETKKRDIFTVEQIQTWQNYEIENLSVRLSKHEKELHVFKYNTDFALKYVFDCVTKGAYDSRQIARDLLKDFAPTNQCVVLVDCDKTLSCEDSAALAFEFARKDKRALKEIFKNDRYSNYQSYALSELSKETDLYNADAIKFVSEKISANRKLIDDLKELKYVSIAGITAGNGKLWQEILKKFGLNIPVLYDDNLPLSSYAKYFVVKELQKQFKYVIAVGDSLLDGLMLKQADKGYIATNKGYRPNIEKLLASADNIFQLEYLPLCYKNTPCEKSISATKTLPQTAEIAEAISDCKSNSEKTGKDLRRAHYKLGNRIAEMIEADFRADNFTVISIMRSGLPFSFGIADYLDCSVLFYDSNNPDSFARQMHDNPELSDSVFIICDAVINSGTTVKKLLSVIGKAKHIIATNVLSAECTALSGVPVYASRISENSYIGAKQRTVRNGKGPDTSDRLFKLIKY